MAAGHDVDGLDLAAHWCSGNSGIFCLRESDGGECQQHERRGGEPDQGSSSFKCFIPKKTGPPSKEALAVIKVTLALENELECQLRLTRRAHANQISDCAGTLAEVRIVQKARWAVEVGMVEQVEQLSP